MAAGSRISQVSLLAHTRTDECRPRSLSLVSCAQLLTNVSRNKPDRQSESDSEWYNKVSSEYSCSLSLHSKETMIQYKMNGAKIYAYILFDTTSAASKMFSSGKKNIKMNLDLSTPCSHKERENERETERREKRWSLKYFNLKKMTLFPFIIPSVSGHISFI